MQDAWEGRRWLVRWVQCYRCCRQRHWLSFMSQTSNKSSQRSSVQCAALETTNLNWLLSIFHSIYSRGIGKIQFMCIWIVNLVFNHGRMNLNWFALLISFHSIIGKMCLNWIAFLFLSIDVNCTLCGSINIVSATSYEGTHWCTQLCIHIIACGLASTQDRTDIQGAAQFILHT